MKHIIVYIHYKSFSLKIPVVKIHAMTSYDVIHYHSFLQSTDVNCTYSLKNVLLLTTLLCHGYWCFNNQAHNLSISIS